MTDSTCKDKKQSQSKRRKTPADLRMENDLRAQTPRTEKPPSREATSDEVRANNSCSYEAARALMDVGSRLDMFRRSVSANRGKGRPQLYSELMIMYGIEVMGFLSIDYRKAAGIVAGLLAPFGLNFPSYSRFYERVASAMETMVLGAPVTDGAYCAGSS